MKAEHFSPDIREFLSTLAKREVKYLIVGGEAVIHYGHARLTGDIDLFYQPEPENVDVLFLALRDFWDGDIPGISASRQLLEFGSIFQFGVPPNRIDLINEIDGVSFDDAWASRITEEMSSGGEEVPITFIGLDELIRNKQAIGRPRDKEDLRFLLQVKKKR